MYFRYKTDTKEAGSFTLSSITRSIRGDIQKNRYRFDVHTPKRVYYLYADSEQERKKWLKYLTPQDFSFGIE